jgi:hypothetical protein
MMRCSLKIKSFNYCLLLNPSSSQVHIFVFHEIFVVSLTICQMQSLPCLASFTMIGPYDFEKIVTLYHYVEMYFNYFHECEYEIIFKSFYNTPKFVEWYQ